MLCSTSTLTASKPRLQRRHQFLFVTDGVRELSGAAADVTDDMRVTAADAKVALLVRQFLCDLILFAA